MIDVGNKQSLTRRIEVSGSFISIGFWLILAVLFYTTPLISALGLDANRIAPVFVYGASTLIFLHAASLIVPRSANIHPLLSKFAVFWGYVQILWLILATGGSNSPLLSLIYCIVIHSSIYWGRRITYILAGSLAIVYALQLAASVPEPAAIVNFVTHFLVLMGLAWLSGLISVRGDRQQSDQHNNESGVKLFQCEYIDSSPVPVVLHSQGEILYVNPAAAELLGASAPAELSGRSIFELIPEGEGEKLRRKLERAGHSSMQTSIDELQAVRLDGRTIQLEVLSKYVHHHTGQTLIQSVLRDTTEQKRKEELIRRSEKLSVVGQLAAGVAHEIRNPLTSLMGFTQLLKSKNEDNHKFFDIMLSELHRINSIVNEFMVLSKPQNVNFRMTSVTSILKSVISLINTQAIMSNVRITTGFEPDLPLLWCDENQLKQLFINLLKNSLEAMPDGGTVRITAEHGLPDKLIIKVIDQGIGIPQQFMTRIGEPFFTTKDYGTGLGLMTCWRIVEAHCGQLNIKSKVNAGTTVEVSLPLTSNAGS
ncbi:ATP-binding protein [Paenibacillus sp. SAFN-117]